MHRTADCVDSHERSKEMNRAHQGNVILLQEGGVLGCPFGCWWLRLTARVISFSSLFYLASVKICSHTYHQLLAGFTAAAAAADEAKPEKHQR